MNVQKELASMYPLFAYLQEMEEELPKAAVHLEGVVNVSSFPIEDYKVETTYTDVFILINMADEYVRLLKEKEHRDPRTDYMIHRLEQISDSLTEQIGLDKDKMWKKVKKEDTRVAEDAMIQLFGKK